jgi:hypothetical protein
MERLEQQSGYIGVKDAFGILSSGLPLYIASAPEQSEEMQLRGGWVDDVGNIHYDWACAYLAKDTALQVGREHNQQCILAIMPNLKGSGRVYLLPDSIRNRVCALRYAGGYTADGKHLLVATNAEMPLGVLGALDCLSADIAFLPCK